MKHVIYDKKQGRLEFDKMPAWGKYRLHREDGPAHIEYYDNGNKSVEGWYLNGKQHRENGPATIWHNGDGTISSEHYWLNGDHYFKEDYNKEMTKLKISLL